MRTRKLEWEDAPDVKRDIVKIVDALDLNHIRASRVFTYRTQGGRARAYARTWMMPKIFQHALGIGPAYVIEVLTRYYDRLSEDEKSKVLIHELLHIPKNFSGTLLSHRGRSRHIGRDANALFKEYKSKVSNR
ncbi:MAG: metallopeptidase [Candidatus Levybacteria bacterium]|nr:metallopeptidase [Candidatus Levybacteria bacterium]